MTLGEYRVGIAFNPSNNDDVSKIKRAAAALIDIISDLPSGGNGEVERLKSLAITHFEDGAMWAVKACTKPVRE